MEDLKENKGTIPGTAEAMKQKYGKVYKVGVTIPIDDESEQEFGYHFKWPSVPSYDRYVKTAGKIGITKASKAFMLDCPVGTAIQDGWLANGGRNPDPRRFGDDGKRPP